VDTPSLSQSFTYNEIGNITYNSQIGTYTYPASGNPRPHAVSAAGTRTYSYNAAGQLTNRNGTVIQWNGDGKPSSIGNVGFVYDGVGTRLKKLSGGQTTKYVGGDYEIAPDGTVTKYLVGGKQVGTSFFVHHRDHLGSIQAVTDNLGAEVRRQKHKPFGDQHYASGSHLESKGWIGEREEETELLYLNARFFDPDVGRFVSPDSIVGLGQRLNRYSYASNSPTNLVDSSGLCPEYPLGAEENCGSYEGESLVRVGRRPSQPNPNRQEIWEFMKISDQPQINSAYRLLWLRVLQVSGEQRELLQNALLALRAPGVTFSFSGNLGNNAGESRYSGTNPGDDGNPNTYLGYGGAQVHVTLAEGLGLKELAVALAHEGNHAYNYQEYGKDVIEATNAGNPRGAENGPTHLTKYDMEKEGYQTSAAAARALGLPELTYTGSDRDNDGQPDLYTIYDGRTIDNRAIDRLIEDLHGVTPSTPGHRIQQPQNFWLTGGASTYIWNLHP
jgi:RHS repeat-associated protein